jgi:hypothetical protein
VKSCEYGVIAVKHHLIACVAIAAASVLGAPQIASAQSGTTPPAPCPAAKDNWAGQAAGRAIAKTDEHEVTVHCKAHPEKRIIEAIAVVFRDERARMGIEMK